MLKLHCMLKQDSHVSNHNSNHLLLLVEWLILLTNQWSDLFSPHFTNQPIVWCFQPSFYLPTNSLIFSALILLQNHNHIMTNLVINKFIQFQEFPGFFYHKFLWILPFWCLLYVPTFLLRFHWSIFLVFLGLPGPPFLCDFAFVFICREYGSSVFFLLWGPGW